MEILHETSTIPQHASLIMGFFDGVHAGHRDVIKKATNLPKIMVTFSSSPAEYFGKNFEYIYPRELNYKLIKDLGIDYIYEQEFSTIAQLTAEEYLKKLETTFNPNSIITGFNHTFGANRQGTPDFLEKNQNTFQYLCTPPTKIRDEIVSSTKIKEYLKNGEIVKANEFLTRNFSIESRVIEGTKLGRKLGFPTANLKYPEKIVRIPYGVYKVKVFGQPAIMNWGIKPTIGANEIVEVHIPNFKENLYGKKVEIEIISKVRDEKKFNNLEELKKQIEKDIEECLK